MMWGFIFLTDAPDKPYHCEVIDVAPDADEATVVSDFRLALASRHPGAVLTHYAPAGETTWREVTQ